MQNKGDLFLWKLHDLTKNKVHWVFWKINAMGKQCLLSSLNYWLNHGVSTEVIIFALFWREKQPLELLAKERKLKRKVTALKSKYSDGKISDGITIATSQTWEKLKCACPITLSIL